MNGSIVVGAQWGDEGKGKVVDLLAEGADVVVRFAGGANAGHTIVVGTEKFVLHLLPSGVLHERVQNILGPGCVVDLESLGGEIDILAQAGVVVPTKRLLVAENAHVVTPYHRILDGLSGGAVGTTGRGIGLAYADKALRHGVRISDLRDGLALERIQQQHAHHSAWAKGVYGRTDLPAPEDVLGALQASFTRIAGYVGDPVDALIDARGRGARVLFEGAQGALLDIDQGTYPFVTSSNTSVAAATAALGTHFAFDRRIGIVKAYTTRVGNGPFPTELHGEEGERLRAKGNEYGATTGRPRRCGWLDIVALKRTFRSNAFTHVVVTKLDVLSGLGPIKVATGDADGVRTYRAFEGFDGDLNDVKSFDELPAPVLTYLRFIEAELSAKVLFLSTGPERDRGLWTEAKW